MEKLRQFWAWITTSRYVRHLEEENRRLKEENRGLLNTLLYQRNLPSIERAGRAGENKAGAQLPRKMSFHQMQFEIDRRAHMQQLRDQAARGKKEAEPWPSPTTQNQ